MTAIYRAPNKSFRARERSTYNAEKPMNTLKFDRSRTQQHDRQVPTGGRGRACCE